MTLLDKARAVPVVDNCRKQEYTVEHYQLAVAFLTGEIKASQFVAATGDKTAASAIPKAWKMLHDGIARGKIAVMCNGNGPLNQ